MNFTTRSKTKFLLISFLTVFLCSNQSFAQLQNQAKKILVTQEMRTEFQQSANEIDFSHQTITNTARLNRENVHAFLSRRIGFQRPLNDIGIANLYRKDYPITLFYLNSWQNFLDSLTTDVLSEKVANEDALRDRYILFVASIKHKIDNKQYNTSLKDPTKKPNAPTPEKQLNGPCVNMDFEDGTTNGWTLTPGAVDGSQQYSFVPGGVVGQSFNVVSAGADPVTGIPMVNPDGGTYSLRLGDGTGYNNGAARISQSFLVTASNYIFTYSYALILQSPEGHSAAETPYFSVRVYDESGNNVTCGAYNVVATTGNEAGFTVITSGSDEIWYKNWMTVFTPLQAYIGQNVTIEFTTGDCSLSGHYGYAYIDASCAASNDIVASALAICEGEPVSLSAPAGADSYTWNTGDTTQDISVSTGGNYSVDVTPFSGSQCAITLDVDISSSPNPVAVFSGAPTNICQGQSIVFTDASTISPPDSIENWQWNFDDGISTPMGNGNINSVTSTSGTYTNPTHTFNSDGNFNVQLIVENAFGCDDTISHPITVTPGPTVQAGADQTVCEGDSVALTASGTAATYTWDNGVTDGANFVQTPGTVDYILTGANGACSSKDTVSLTVLANPTPTITGTTYCVGSTATLDAGAGYDAYLWSDGSTGQTATFTDADNPISVTVTMNPGCDGSSQNVNVIEIPSITHDSTIAICQGQSVSIFGTSQSVAGIFSQTYVAASGCDSTSNVTLVVNPLPAIDAGLDTTICSGAQITLTASNPSSATISWNNGVTDGMAFSAPTTTTTYIVTASSSAGGSSGELVVNGNFENGNVGFTSGLTYSCTCLTSAYCIGADPDSKCNSSMWTNNLWDHTFGTSSGNYMLIDGNSTNNNLIWSQSGINVSTGTNYTFSFWVMPELSNGSMQPSFNILIDGVVIGTFSTQTLPSQVWANYTTTWSAPSSGAVTLEIRQISPISGFNDFGIDDISFAGPSLGAQCSNTDSITVIVTPSPTINAGIDQDICFGDSIALSGSGNGVGNYIWDNGIQNDTSFSPAITITYTVTDTSAIGCVGSDQITITVNPLPNVNASDTSVCEGNLIALYGTGAQSYSWSNGVQDSVSFIPLLGTTTYYVTGTDTNGCVNSDSAVVTVYPFPVANITANPTTGFKPLVVNFTNNSTGGGNYNWDFGDGNAESSSDLSGTTHIYPIEGSYIVILQANSNGCLDTATITITVNPYGPVGYKPPNVFTPNGDGQNDIFHLSLIDAESVEIQIFNRWGNHMKTVTDVKNSGGWDGKTKNGHNASEGTYFYLYHILGKNGESVDGQGFVQLVRK